MGGEETAAVCLVYFVGDANSGHGYFAGSYAWLLVWPASPTTSVAVQSCLVAVQPYTGVCVGTDESVRLSNYGPDEVTVYPGFVCVWEPVDSPSAGSLCNYQRVTVGYSKTTPANYTYYVDAELCPVPTSTWTPWCLPELFVSQHIPPP